MSAPAHGRTCTGAEAWCLGVRLAALAPTPLAPRCQTRTCYQAAQPESTGEAHGVALPPASQHCAPNSHTPSTHTKLCAPHPPLHPPAAPASRQATAAVRRTPRTAAASGAAAAGPPDWSALLAAADPAARECERSGLVNEEAVYLIFQLELDAQLQRALNYEAYEAAQKVRAKRETVRGGRARVWWWWCVWGEGGGRLGGARGSGVCMRVSAHTTTS